MHTLKQAVPRLLFATDQELDMNRQDYPLVSLAILKAKPGQAPKLKAALLALIEPTRAEPGNRDYMLFERSDEPGTFYMREAFDHQQALDAHLTTAHFQRFAEQAEQLLAEPLQLIFLDPVSSVVAPCP
ncbi:antibiotic biosynthesis monooxygenase [Pseudomonas putida]|jgi:quinol monooxygenase YgiN|uniref:Antibiotic biosynthesis monooxygenase n=2 Tax=Pseudomonas putida TaxID=303 RepID=A0A8I1EBV1_PSEPU|nr:antibiotic biosynthesis monooxygenase [Pseudomonas putida]